MRSASILPFITMIISTTVYCTSNLADETFQYLREGDKYIDLQNHEDLIIILGKTGTGKSTLVKFLSGDESKLQSVKINRYTYIFSDGGVSISNGTAQSKTFYPEITIDKTTNAVLVDNPGFGDTRSSKIEIANAYFINKIINRAKKIKIVLVATEAHVTVGEDRTGYTDLLHNIVKLIKNFSKFNSSIALVVTKVRNNYPFVSDEEIIMDIEHFLSEVKFDLLELKNKSENNSNKNYDAMIELNEMILNSGSIGIFRRPDIVGSISKSELLMNNKKKLRELLFSKINFMTVHESDFHYSLTSDAILYIKDNLFESMNSNILNEIENVNNNLIETLNKNGVGNTNNSLLLNELNLIFLTLSESAENIQDDISLIVYLETAMEIGNYKQSLKGEAIGVIEQSIFFRKFVEEKNKNYISNYISSIQNAITYIEFLKTSYFLLVTMENSFETFLSQKLYRNHNVLRSEIAEENFEDFLSQIRLFIDDENRKYLSHSTIRPPIFIIREFNAVVNHYFRHEIIYTCDENIYLTIEGNFLLLSDYFNNHLPSCKSNKIKGVILKAKDKAFINVNSDTYLQNLIVLAPYWEVYHAFDKIAEKFDKFDHNYNLSDTIKLIDINLKTEQNLKNLIDIRKQSSYEIKFENTLRIFIIETVDASANYNNSVDNLSLYIENLLFKFLQNNIFNTINLVNDKIIKYLNEKGVTHTNHKSFETELISAFSELNKTSKVVTEEKSLILYLIATMNHSNYFNEKYILVIEQFIFFSKYLETKNKENANKYNMLGHKVLAEIENLMNSYKLIVFMQENFGKFQYQLKIRNDNIFKTEMNYENFLNNIRIFFGNELKINTNSLFSNEYILRDINNTLNYYVHEKLLYSCSHHELTLKSNFILLSDVLNTNNCNINAVINVAIYAVDTVFFNTDIIINGLNIAIIAPKLDIIGSRSIQLDGKIGDQLSFISASNANSHLENGADGLPGNPGYNGGNFIGVALNVINGQNLFIQSNGGQGGLGQNGGNGAPGVTYLPEGYEYILDGESIFHYLLSSIEGYGYRQEYMIQLPDTRSVKNFIKRREYYYFKLGITRIDQIIPTNGGHGGSGGKGGFAGLVKLKFKNIDTDLLKINTNLGPLGINGKGGKGGEGKYKKATRIYFCTEKRKFNKIGFKRWKKRYSLECRPNNNENEGENYHFHDKMNDGVQGLDGRNDDGIREPEIVKPLFWSENLNSYIAFVKSKNVIALNENKYHDFLKYIDIINK